MEEKYMVRDILEDFKQIICNFQKNITETENLELRKVIKDQRDNKESLQYELLKISQTKGYYNFNFQVNQNEINEVKREIE